MVNDGFNLKEGPWRIHNFETCFHTFLMRNTFERPQHKSRWWLGAALKDVEKVFVLFAHCDELLLWYTPGGGGGGEGVEGGGGGGGDDYDF